MRIFTNIININLLNYLIVNIYGGNGNSSNMTTNVVYEEVFYNLPEVSVWKVTKHRTHGFILHYSDMVNRRCAFIGNQLGVFIITMLSCIIHMNLLFLLLCCSLYVSMVTLGHPG